MATGNSEVFLLYNERETFPDFVASELRDRGVSLYFYRSDLPLGSNIRDIEAKQLRAARGVVVLLGNEGWGVSQAEIGQQAVSLGKPIVPVLIGNPPEQAMDQVGALFRTYRRLDLREPSPALFDELARAIERMAPTIGATRTISAAPAAPRFDEIINTLVDGSDLDRSTLLQRIIRYPLQGGAELARRLRAAIGDAFSPGQENQFATAVRAPKRLSSTRSWMLSVLIWLEPTTAESQAVILEHIQAELEPDREVRFWTLAGIVQRRLPYLKEALDLARNDPATEISGLSAIVAEPRNAITLRAFRTALASEEFEIAWHVLRILRIVPVPDLVEDVVRQLDRRADSKPLTYDVLFALASSEMAQAARPIILERPGLDRFVELVVQEARSAAAIARSAFAHVLSVFDDQQVRAALQNAAQDGESRQLVQRMLHDIAEVRSTEDLGEPPIAGFSSDAIDISHDDIGISKDVETLASVILARDVTPPLAIGLFGEWGSGKSFFMRSIEAASDRIAKEAKAQKRSQFCTDIVQITFNAWHYADANLWASLVSHLLDGLSHHVAPTPNAAEQQATLAGELASAKAEMAAAQFEQERATSHLKDAARSLQDRIIERERREVRLRDLRAADLLALLDGDKELDSSLKDALKSVGAPAALESIGELNKVVEESYSTAGRATALLVSLITGRNILFVFLGIVFFFAAPPLIQWALEHIWGAYAGALSAIMAKVTVVAGSLTLILRTALAEARTGLDALSRAKRRVDERLAEKRATPTDDEKRLEGEVREARVSEKAAVDRLSAASARAQDLESRVTLLKESQSLGYFIAERSRSDDYRRHLGLISMIRKDFDDLVARLKSAGNEQGRQIDRIILYIDDVDRCPPNMVVDILQAVHLLLAYELFVVVVSVDPRWLLRSLESRFSTLQSDTDSETWGATAQDYLEKIFQIPFSVRPMGNLGFTRLMGRLLAPSTVSPPAEIISNAPNPTPAAPFREDNADSRPLDGGGDRPTDPSPAPAPAPTEIDALVEALSIRAGEAEFARTLYRLLPTPRGAKRFTNIYRLLKASLPGKHLSRFEGSDGVPGEFQLPMLLLALLVGQSKATALLFPQFLASAADGQPIWWASGDRGAAEPIELIHLRAWIDEIARAPLFPSAPELVVEWLPQVARYSFTTAGMFLSDRERSSARRTDPPANADFART